jgi:predicted aminopeptidase
MSLIGRAFIVVTLGTMLSGCALPYYLQAVGGQLELLRKRTPLETLLADPAISPDLRSALESAIEVRRFAVEVLGLPDNDSYLSYVDLERNYVVWNVIAAEEFSVDPVRWCFPFAGCVAYRGYFDRERAEGYAASLATEGFDAYSGGASAYSTLGYFDDPLLNTMLAGGEEYIAALLFHELAHQRLYVKSDSEFNEAFATAVEEYGLELWLQDTRGDAALAAYRERMLRRAQFGELVANQQTRLRALYAEPLDADAMRAAKRAAFTTMRDEYARLKAQWGGISEYDGWFARALNNASLAAIATYRQWLPALRTRLETLGIEGFYDEMERLAALPSEERYAWLEAWSEGLSAPSAAPES